MKLYDCRAAANPRTIRMALAEKAIDVECVQIDLFKGEQHGEAFRKINPFGSVPCLELDDGAVIGESAAIARYLEARQPEPRLLGSTPKEQAVIAMWQRRVEDGVLNAATTFFHHATSGLGETSRYRNADWGQANKKRLATPWGCSISNWPAAPTSRVTGSRSPTSRRSAASTSPRRWASSYPTASPI